MSFWRLSIDALVERRTRTALTILMVVIGASLLIAINGMSTGMMSFMEGQFSQLGGNLLMVSPKDQDFEIDAEVISYIETLQGVDEVIPYYQQGVLLKSSRGRTINTFLIGMDQSKLSVMFPSISFMDGTTVSTSDNLGIVLGNDVIEEDNEDGPLAFLGDSVKLSFLRTGDDGRPVEESASYSVRGRLDYLGSNFIPVDQMAFISTQSANSFLDRGGTYDGIYVYTLDDSFNKAISRQIKDSYDANVINPQQITEMIDTIMGAMMGFINGIAIVSLLVAAIGIVAAQYTSMMERIKEIGMMKALGYTERQILVLFLNEAMIIGIIGGILGVIVGMILGNFMSAAVSGMSSGSSSSSMSGGMSFGAGGLSGGGASSFRGFSLVPVFEPQIVVFTIIMCLILAILAGFYPAQRAAKLNPVDALRKE
ncbi:MAG: ABC transporter permease [Candidatus Hodarchaeales archaeon]